jgi:hypothetical protein
MVKNPVLSLYPSMSGIPADAQLSSLIRENPLSFSLVSSQKADSGFKVITPLELAFDISLLHQ